MGFVLFAGFMLPLDDLTDAYLVDTGNVHKVGVRNRVGGTVEASFNNTENAVKYYNEIKEIIKNN